jgi:hypothetical protein
MSPNGTKWFHITWSGSKWLEIALNISKDGPNSLPGHGLNPLFLVLYLYQESLLVWDLGVNLPQIKDFLKTWGWGGRRELLEENHEICQFLGIFRNLPVNDFISQMF